MAESKIQARHSKRGSMTLESDRFGITKKVFCKEYARDNLSKGKPGPTDYKVQSINKKAQVKHTIPSTDRNLLTIKKDDGPSPVSYNMGPSPSQVSLQASQRINNAGSRTDLRAIVETNSRGLQQNPSLASLRVYASPKGGKFGTSDRFNEYVI